MPTHRRQIGELQEDIWKQNETILRRLYLRERKTLKDVKKSMESEYGFPTTPLSTYESKLRDLGLRKKMKKKDWHPIYQHYMDSGQRHRAIYFNGTRIPWDKAWKEIRRSGARECNDGHVSGLPADVVMRSPSPGLVFPSAAPSYMPIPWRLSDISSMTLSPAAMVHRLRFYEIPSNLLRMNMRKIFESEESSYDHNSQLNMTESRVELASLNQSSSLFCRNSQRPDIDSDIDELSGALYRIANSYVSQPVLGKPLTESWDIIINKTPTYVLLKILENESHSPTVQVVVEMLAEAFSRLNRKDDFLSLIKFICRLHPDWNFRDQYLTFVGRLGCVDSYRLLLQRRTERNPSNNDYDPHHYITAVLNSIATGHIECAKIMLGHVFENVLVHKIFACFLCAVAKGSYELEPNIVPFGRQNPAVLHMLEWFLGVGANVDLPASYLSPDYIPLRYLSVRYLSATCRSLGFVPVKPSKNVQPAYHYTMYTPRNWMPTILDYLYFENPELYSCLINYSTKYKTEITRSGIHCSASDDIGVLRTYLLTRLSHTPAEQDTLLEICLTEEFLRSETNERVDFNVISTLLDYNIGLEKFRLKLSASTMLYYAIKAASQQGMHPAVYHIVKTLIYMGAVISAETMDEAVEVKGTILLELLSSYGADFENQGAMALCTAIKLDNYEAVNRFLDLGVNVNATLRGHGQEEELTILAHANMHINDRIFRVFTHERYLGDQTISLISCKMLEYLISRNVKLRANPADPDPRRLLDLLLRYGLMWGDWNDTFNKIKVLLDAEPLTSDQSRTAPCLLEACFTSQMHYDYNVITQVQRILLLDYLIDHGISVSHSGVLARMILDQAPESKIRILLNSGVDVNAYCGQNLEGDLSVLQRTSLQAAAQIGSLDLARLLVQRGADVNRPAKGIAGRTALQAACEQEQLGLSRSIDLIKFLIDCGADVNAPPASKYGLTAFQAAAKCGDFELVLLLLDNGADINAPPSEYGYFCALDGSVFCGKLDMVQFLLGLGALSFQGGESGYRGAIACAEEYGHSFIADMIRQHALKNGKSGEELFTHWEQWEDSSSEFDDDSDDTNETDDKRFEDEEFWEDWLPF